MTTASEPTGAPSLLIGILNAAGASPTPEVGEGGDQGEGPVHDGGACWHGFLGPGPPPNVRGWAVPVKRCSFKSALVMTF